MLTGGRQEEDMSGFPFMKTASLGLLEVMVVRVNAGGDAPRIPPLLVTSRLIPPFFVFFKKRFLAMSGIIFLANERDNFLARALRITRNHIKQMAGLGSKLSSDFLGVLRPAFCKNTGSAERRTQNSQFRDYRLCSVLVFCVLRPRK